MKKILSLVALSGFAFPVIAQNVGINATGNTPNASAMLDVESTDKGILIPRVSLNATNVVAPVTTPANSLMVYNTNTAGSGITAVSPGYYYWNGSNWARVATDGENWKLLGNAGIDPAINFLGTTDAQPLVIRTNNIDRIRVMTDNATQNRVGIGTNFPTSYPSGATPTLLHVFDGGNTANDFGQIQIGAAKTTATNKVGELNFHSTVNAGDRRTASIESYVTAVSGIPNVSGDLRFFTNNSTTAVFSEKMRIQADGFVGINTTQPIYLTDIRSNNNKGTSITPEEYLLHIGSANAVDPLGLKIGIRTHNTTTNRYGAIEVDDAGNKRALSLQPNGGNVGVGMSLPSFKTEVFDANTEMLLGLHRSSTTAGHIAGLFFRVHNTGANNYKGAILFERTETNGRGSLHFVTSNISNTVNVTVADAKMTLNREGNLRIGVVQAATVAPAQADASNIRMDVVGGYTRIGNFNSGNNAADHPGTSFTSGVGALAIGMNRQSSTSNVDFWNTTSNTQATANLSVHRGFDFRRYDSSGSEELVMGIRGDGLLTLTSNNATTEGAQLLLNNAGIAASTETNSWAIDNHNSATAAHTLRFFYNANSTPSLVIPSHANGAARVGINIATGVIPTTTLQVGGDIAANSGYRTKAGSAAGIGGNLFNFNWTGTALEAWIDVTMIGQVQLASDYRIKHSINEIESGLSKIMTLRPVTYRIKDIEIFKDNGVDKAGFIAHELQEVIPSAVIGEKDAVNEKGGMSIQTIDPLPIISLLTKAIQEQQVIIENQGAEINALRAEVEKAKENQEIMKQLELLKVDLETVKSEIRTENTLGKN
ncbi:MAG: tail fiber domain-containing protein [Flavobacteriales bacterium]